MKYCIDIGGTKVLISEIKADGTIGPQTRFTTPKVYTEMIENIAESLTDASVESPLVVGAPGKIDRDEGSVVAFGNLPWRDVQLATDLQKALKIDKVVVENDANLAALGEFYALSKEDQAKMHQILYITISTGIGTGIITNGQIDPDHHDSEGGHLLIEHKGELVIWESIASGQAIVREYGKRASEINDPQIWSSVAKRLAVGIINLLTMTEPDLVIIGGGVGTHFKKYEQQLEDSLAIYKPLLIDIPPIVQASQPENAVILGCIKLGEQLAATDTNASDDKRASDDTNASDDKRASDDTNASEGQS